MTWFEKGAAAFRKGEPIGNGPRTSDVADTQQWRKGWLSARDGDAWMEELDDRSRDEAFK